MTTWALDYPLGRPLLPAAQLNRRRPAPLGVAPLVQPGDRVRADQMIAEAPDRSQVVLAGMSGRVREVVHGRDIAIEGPVMYIAGALGLGAAAVGPLAFLPRGESIAMVPIPAGAILVYPQRIPLTLLQRAISGGVAGIIAASASALELEAILRIDLTALYDGLLPEGDRFPIPLALTEGLGERVMDSITLRILTQRAGEFALVSGMTDPRRNMRPEILLSLPPDSPVMPLPADSALVVGARVRVVAGEYRDAHGQIVHIFPHRRLDHLGFLSEGARLRLENGLTCSTPLHTLERLA
jgi:hypothetical protein